MRIEQNHTFLTSQIQMAMSGHLGIVAFQREYAWNEADVEALFYSLLQEWPIGSFLTWEPHENVEKHDIQRGNLGPVQTNYECRRFLLDGQNRLATFAWAYAGDKADRNNVTSQERGVWLSGRSLVADFSTRSVKFVDEAEAYDGERVPLGDIIAANLVHERGKKFELGQRLLDSVSDDAINWLMDEVPNKIREARVVETVLVDATVQEAKDAFLRICKSGQPISEAEFERAMEWQPHEPTRF